MNFVDILYINVCNSYTTVFIAMEPKPRGLWFDITKKWLRLYPEFKHIDKDFRVGRDQHDEIFFIYKDLEYKTKEEVAEILRDPIRFSGDDYQLQTRDLLRDILEESKKIRETLRELSEMMRTDK